MRYVLAGCMVIGLLLGVACSSAGGSSESPTVVTKAPVSSTEALRNADDARWEDAIKPGQPGKLTDALTVIVTAVAPMMPDGTITAHLRYENRGDLAIDQSGSMIDCGEFQYSIAAPPTLPAHSVYEMDATYKVDQYDHSASPDNCPNPAIKVFTKFFAEVLEFQVPKS